MIQDDLNRFDRTLAILILLQSRKRITAQQLSDRFEVSLRTIYRDIRSLEAAGVPIIGEAGVGYSIMEGYRLPPVMFTREEAGSFIAAEKLMQKFTDAALRSSFESAMNKVKSVLRGKEKDLLEALEDKVWVTQRGELFNKDIPNALEILFNSIAAQKQVFMQYKSFDADAPSMRYIEPVGVFHENTHWHLYAYCHLRHDYRQFRTDRILSIKSTDVAFTRNHTNIKEYTNKKQSKSKTKVVITVSKEVVRYIGSNLEYYGLVRQEEKENEVLLEFQSNDSLDSLAKWYLMFGDHARVIEPEDFRVRVRELTEKTTERLSL